MGKRYRKRAIPKALRETLWIYHNGKEFEAKCSTPWCTNIINVYDFHAGHRIPEVHGGPTTLENLIPLCPRCNLSMGSQYTFEQWSALSEMQNTVTGFWRWCCCIKRKLS